MMDLTIYAALLVQQEQPLVAAMYARLRAGGCWCREWVRTCTRMHKNKKAYETGAGSYGGLGSPFQRTISKFQGECCVCRASYSRRA